MTTARLLVAYNAEAGLLAGVLDSVHKLASPATYPCRLCALTYGLVTMDRRWRDWLRRPPLPVVVHHRPDFRAAWPAAANWPLPLVALADGAGLTLLLGPEALADIADAGALIAAIMARLPPALAFPGAND